MSEYIVSKALVYAADKAANQYRTKGLRVPLLSHLLGVSDIAYQYRDSAFSGSDLEMDELIVGALLHELGDSKDWASIQNEVSDKFGPNVLKLVEGCIEPCVEGDYFSKKMAYFDFLAKSSDSVAFILACDELHDLKVIFSSWLRNGPSIWQTIPAGAKNTLWYYEGLCRVFSRNGSHPLLSEMEYLLAVLNDEVEQALPYIHSGSISF